MSKKRPLIDENNSEVANLAATTNLPTPLKPVVPRSPDSGSSSTTLVESSDYFLESEEAITEYGEEPASPIIPSTPGMPLALSSFALQTFDKGPVNSSHGAAAAMPDWLRKVLNGNDFAYSTESKENSGEYKMGSGSTEIFDNPVSRANILEYVTTKVDSNSSDEELSATVPEFVSSSPSISRVSVSNPFFSPYSSGSPSTPTRSPAPYTETSPIAGNGDVGLDYARGFSLDHLSVRNTAPSDEGIAAMLGDAADFSGLDSEY